MTSKSKNPKTMTNHSCDENSVGVSFKEFCKLAKSENIVSNWIEVLADLETPVSIYSKLHSKSKDAFLLESVEGGEKIGRYSFIGYKPLKIISSDNEDSYAKLSKEFESYKQKSKHGQLPFFHKGFVGYISFETIKYIETHIETKKSRFPEMYTCLVGSLAVFDHVKHKLYLISNTITKANQEKPPGEEELREMYDGSIAELEELKNLIQIPHELENILIDEGSEKDVEFKSNVGKDKFTEIVNKAKEYISEGDIFQVVPSHVFTAEKKLDPLHAYRILRAINPSPYLFLLNVNSSKINFSLVGSSPEMLVKCTHDEDKDSFQAELRPIAGTYKRGASVEEDEELAEKLLSDPKEVSEHVMLVDLARNDLGKVCENSSIYVPENMVIEKYSHVLHIVSSVKGKLRPNSNGVELIKACFPAGTLSGAPKVRAMEIIEELEVEARGPYGGCVCYLGLDGTLDNAMTIRTLIIEENQVSVRAGCGVVADSDPEKEYQETLNKAGALMKVVRLAK